VLVRQRKKNGEEKEPKKGENQRKKKEVEEITWVHHYPFARGARSPANDSVRPRARRPTWAGRGPHVSFFSFPFSFSFFYFFFIQQFFLLHELCT
jgi:hypothetical protein